MSGWVESHDHGLGSPALDVLADVQRRGDVASHTTGECQHCHLTRPLFRFTQTEWLTAGGTSIDSSERQIDLCSRCFSATDTDLTVDVEELI